MKNMQQGSRRVALLLASALPILAEESTNLQGINANYIVGKGLEELEQQEDLYNVYDDDETLTVTSLPKIPLHQTLQLPETLSLLLEEGDEFTNALVFPSSAKVSSAARFRFQFDDDVGSSETCRGRLLPSLPLTVTSPIMIASAIRTTTTTGTDPNFESTSSPTARVSVRPHTPASVSDVEITRDSGGSTTLGRLEASLQSYFGRLLPSAFSLHYGDNGKKSCGNEEVASAGTTPERIPQDTEVATVQEYQSVEIEPSRVEDILFTATTLDYEPFVCEEVLDDAVVESFLEELLEKERRRPEEMILNGNVAPSTDGVHDERSLMGQKGDNLDSTTGTIRLPQTREIAGVSVISMDSNANVTTAGMNNTSHYEGISAIEIDDTTSLQSNVTEGGRSFSSETYIEQSSSNDTSSERIQPNDNFQQESVEKEEEEDDETLYERVSVDYASKSAGALIIEKSQNFKGTSNLLNGDRDKYAITPCSEERKSVVVSLSEDILVKVIKLANYERFSSTIKDFQVLGSQTLEKWVDLGSYRAQSGHGEQVFPLLNPTWVRYLKFKFLTHHGVEYYCTLSQIKVHGSTMVQGFHEQWEKIEEEQESGTDLAEIAPTDTSDEEKTGREGAEINADDQTIRIADDIGTSRKEGSMDPDDELPRLDNFQSSATLLQMLEGDLRDEFAVSEFYDQLPSALGSIPPHSKLAMERTVLQDDSMCAVCVTSSKVYLFARKRIRHDSEIGSLTSYYNSSNMMMIPKMKDLTTISLLQRFVDGLPQNITVNLTRPLEPISEVMERLDRNTSAENALTPSVRAEDRSEDTTSTNQVTDFPGKGVELQDPIVVQISRVIDSEPRQSSDPEIGKLLQNLPKADCLSELDFNAFKSRISSTRKSTGSGTSQGGGTMEPIFKKLMDEIISLQTSLSAHEQFMTTSFACYRRVMLELTVELETLKGNHEDRLAALEKQMKEPAIVRYVRTVVQLLFAFAAWFVWKLPYWYKFAKMNLSIPLFEWCCRQSTIISRCLLPYWRRAKQSLDLLNDSLRINRTMNTILGYMDSLVELLSTTSDRWIRDDIDHSSTAAFFSAWTDADERILAFPLVPIVVFLLVCRIIMCFASPSNSSGSSVGRTVPQAGSRLKRRASRIAAASTSPSSLPSRSSTHSRRGHDKNLKHRPNGHDSVSKPQTDHSGNNKSVPRLIPEDGTANGYCRRVNHVGIDNPWKSTSISA